ncbi:MAG TPA: toll/interleukin-1 receptor domain-containing protein [Verrucomicrobiales bacterium]|jgi:hypothetical protein|nr:toll/interleukin-1 receptor domain-containing protein [Verrucomicrobiales bacterium]
MAFLDGFRHDVFVSYAHNDNEPYVEGDRGWVKNLVKAIRTRVVQKLGTASVDIWMDYQLRGNDSVTTTIESALNQSALLLFVSSRSYLASGWCRNELNGFLTESVGVRRRGPEQRLFMVQYDKIDRSELPSSLHDLIGYQFWTETDDHAVTLGYPTPDPNQTTYWSLVNKLAVEIAETLLNLKAGSPERSGPVVHLAEVTEDMELVRQEVEGFLRQAGITVVPTTYYPRSSPSDFQEAVDHDLKNAKLFVQLLSSVPGRKPPELPQGYSGLQYQRALAAKKEILQWRPPALDLKSVTDPEHQKLLGSKTVVAESLETFKQRIKNRLSADEVRVPLPIDKLIFVNTESGDRNIAQQIADCIYRKGFGYALSRETNVRKDLAERLHQCDGAIIVYKSSPPKWVERQQDYILTILRNMQRPPPIVAIYEGPPIPKQTGLNQRFFQTFPFDEVVDCDVLEPFLSLIRRPVP